MNAWSIEVEAVERGTDSALLASDKPTNFDLLAINGSGEVTTSNPASGGGSAHTAQDVANLILVTPANKLATDVSGNVEANNMRGTDGANTVAPVDVSADVTAILADTNELQTNQGQWLTATGFSTFDHTTDAVITDTASRDASKADVSGLSTFDATTDQVVASNMRGTDGANTIAPVDVSASVALILADTNELQQNQGQWLTATGFNTVAPDNASIAAILADTDDLQSNQGDWLTADISGLSTQVSVNALQATADAILNDTEDLQTHQGDWATADVSGLATQASIDALNDFNPATDTVANVTLVDTTTNLTNGGGGGGNCPTAQEIVDTWGNQPQGSYTTSGTLGFYLDAQVSTAGSGGTGLYQATVRVQDDSNNALQGARINVDGTTLTLTTNSQGEVTFNLDSGVYLLDVSPPAGYDTPTGQVLTVLTSDPADTLFTLASNASGCTPPWLG